MTTEQTESNTGEPPPNKVAKAPNLLTDEEEAFLRALMSWQGVATTSETHNAGGGSARQACKRKGLVTYDGTGTNNGYWRLTDEGRRIVRLMARR